MATSQLPAAIRSLLELIDQDLAHAEVTLGERPFKATVRFVRDFVMAVNLGGEPEVPPASLPELLEAPWTASLFIEVNKWYRDRYGSAVDQHSDASTGFVLLYGSPFELRVPLVESAPEEPGKTSWLTFLNEVRGEDDPTAWIVNPPALADVQHIEMAAVHEVAGLLRSINVKLLGIPSADQSARGLLRGIPVHLRAAADLAMRPWRDGAKERGFWELQMACECAYKGLMQVTTGAFRETHDLFALFDDAAPYGVKLLRDMIKDLPRWRDSKSLHYGQAPQPSLGYYYHAYRTTLRIVDSVLEPAVTLDLSRASLKLAADSWHRALWDNDDRTTSPGN